MSSYTPAGPKIELEQVLSDTRLIEGADLIAIAIYTQDIYVIIKCTHLLQVEQGIMPLKKNTVIDKDTFTKALSMSKTPLVFSSSYLNMEPYREPIMTYKQKIEELQNQ